MNQESPNPSTPDPLIDEVRAIRRRLSERFDNDVKRLAEELRKQETLHKDRLVNPPTPEERSKRAG